jgi:poly(3-hydroxybutyrate) depolymerase
MIHPVRDPACAFTCYSPSVRSHLLPFALVALPLACSSSAPPVGPGPTDGGTGADTTVADGALGGDGGAGCVTSVTAGAHVFTCEGLSITVSAPASCPPAGCGLILDVHGIFMDADVEDAMTHLRALGNAAGYVVVQPTAPSGRAPQGPVWFDTDDTAVFAAVQDVAAAWKVDATRMHVTGVSQGGYMTWRLVCAHSDVFGSAAPGLAGTPGCPANNLNGGCAFTSGSTPSRKLPLLFMAGTKDALVPSSCTTAQRDAVISAWALGPKQVVASDATYRRERYAGVGEATMDFLSFDYTTDPSGALAANAGHCVAGGSPTTGTYWDSLPCKGPVSFQWGQEVVAFFVAHGKK